MSWVSKVLKDIDLEKVRKYLVERKGDALEAKPGAGGIVNIYFVVEALSDLVLRHEGGDDLTEITIGEHEVPAITDTKLDAAYRRTAVQLLGSVFKEYTEEVREAIRSSLNQLMQSNDNITKAIVKVLLEDQNAGLRTLNEPYKCALRPYGVGGKQYIKGLCRECPNCYLFGFAIPEEGGEGVKRIKVKLTDEDATVNLEIGNYNVQSRVRGDLYPATAPSSIITGFRTHNAPDDITKVTGQALMTIRYVRAGSTFVGKISFYDVSLNELAFLLATLSKVPRIGAMWSDYGRVKVHVAAILFADQEVGSGYEIAENIFSRTRGERVLSTKEVLEEVTSYAKEFESLGYLYENRELTERLFKLNRESMKDIVIGTWVDTVKLKVAYEHFTT